MLRRGLVVLALATAFGTPSDASQARVADTITPGGPPVTVTVSSPGGSTSATFTGVAGRRVSLWTSGSTISSYTVKILQPGGSTLASSLPLGTSPYLAIDATTLPVSGTYTIVVTARLSYSGNLTLTLYDVPPDASASTTPGGGSVSLTTTVPGQNGVVTFPGTAGNRISVYDGANSISTARVSIYNPDGSLLVSNPSYLPHDYLAIDATTLPATGTYRLVMNPSLEKTGTIVLTVYDVPPDVGDLLTIGGPSHNETTTVPGQNIFVNFNGAAGQQIKLTVSGGPSCHVAIYNPDATVLIKPAPLYCGFSHVFATTLTQSGLHSISVDPYIAGTGTVTLTLDGSPGAFGAPQIFGLANAGEWLTATAGTWTPTPTSTAFQWQRCSWTGDSWNPPSCVDLFGQTAALYQVTDADVGSTLRVRVTATNANGSGVAYSAAVPVLGPIVTVATDFRPGIFFDTGEHWRPLNVPDFLSETFPDGGHHQLCYEEYGGLQCPPQGPPGEGDFGSSYTKLDIYGNRGDASSFYSPWACDKPTGSYDCDGDSHSAIYFEPTRDYALGYTYLDYWFFYRYNDSPDVTGDHEGDWEGMTVVIDPTGPPDNSGQPVAAYALYAAHDGKTWSAYLGDPNVPHIPAFVGRGTHSTNPNACPSDCGFYEWSYDGNVPWALDASGGPEPGQISCDGCVIRFPDQPWVSWDGSWGTSDEGILPGGGSPPSPGRQSRFTCAQNLYYGDCPTPPFEGQPALRLLHVGGATERIGGPAAAASSCGAWEGTAAAVAVCEPARLRAALVQRRLDERVRPSLRLPGFKGRIVAADGITQAIGRPLRPGQRVALHGTLAAGSEVVLHLESHARRWVARFRIPGLGARRQAAIRITGAATRPLVSLRLPNRVLRPDFLRLER